MKIIGYLMLFAGMFVAIVAFGMDVSVEGGEYGSRIVNNGLVANRANYMVFGCMLAVIGAIFIAACAVIEGVRSAGQNVRDALVKMRDVGGSSEDFQSSPGREGAGVGTGQFMG